MKTTILVNSLLELKTVANFYGIEVKAAEIVVSFPYRLEVKEPFGRYGEETFQEFKRRYPDFLKFK